MQFTLYLQRSLNEVCTYVQWSVLLNIFKQFQCSQAVFRTCAIFMTYFFFLESATFVHSHIPILILHLDKAM
jgi:hypothetical protein